MEPRWRCGALAACAHGLRVSAQFRLDSPDSGDGTGRLSADRLGSSAAPCPDPLPMEQLAFDGRRPVPAREQVTLTVP